MQAGPLEQVLSVLRQIARYNVRHAQVQPDRAALLVIDMQRYFEGLAEPIRANVVRLIEACRASGVRIAYTQHGHRKPRADGGMLAEWWGDLIRCNTPHWELIPDIEPRPSEKVFDKNRYSAFHGTKLERWLDQREAQELIICGVMTNCCCETTARDAFVRDYRVFFVADATATINDELHLASLKTLAYGFAYVVTTHDLCAQLQPTA